MGYFILSVITVVFIGGIAGYLGSLMLTKRMALVAGPIGHLALPGVALALMYKFGIFFGALLSIGVGAFLIWIFSLRSKIPMEALTAIVFASGVALGFLFLPLVRYHLSRIFSNFGIHSLFFFKFLIPPVFWNFPEFY